MNHPSEETILAYIDGAVETPVRTHIRECKQCSGIARRFIALERELLSTLYRKDCPDPMLLAEYRMKLVSSNDQLIIRAHLTRCALCRAELAQIEIEQQRGINLLDRVAAVLDLNNPQRDFAAVRGDEAEMLSSWPRVYNCPQIEIFLSLKQGEMPGLYAIQGLLTSSEGETLSKQPVMLRSAANSYNGETDDLGNFAFTGVEHGQYTLTIVLDDVLVDIQPLAIGVLE